MSFECVICMKTVKSGLFKKYLKRRNRGHGFVSLFKYQSKKIIEHCNSVGAGAQKVGKVVSFWPNFDPNFLDIWKV